MIRNNSTWNSSGQLFVLGALLIAIILVSLAFSLNMVIYSENTSARGSAVAEETAMDHQQTFPRELGRLTNEYITEEFMDRTTLDDSATSAMDLLFDAEKRRQANRNALLDIDYTMEYGILLGQDDFSRNYTAEGGETDWALTTTAKPIRKYHQRVDPSSLNAVADSDISTNGLLNLDLFYVEFEDSSGVVREVVIYQSSDTSDYRIEVNGQSPCTVPSTASEINIDYKENTVNGNDCTPLSFTTGKEWEFRYNNSDQAAGTYGIIVGDSTESDVETDNFVDPTSQPGSNPFFHHAITRIDYSTRYTSQTKTFTTDGHVISELPGDLT